MIDHVELEGLEEMSILLGFAKKGGFGASGVATANQIEKGIQKSVTKTGAGILGLANLVLPTATANDYMKVAGSVAATVLNTNLASPAVKQNVQQHLANSKDPLERATGNALGATMAEDKRLHEGIVNGDISVIAEIGTDLFTQFTVGVVAEGVISSLPAKSAASVVRQADEVPMPKNPSINAKGSLTDDLVNGVNLDGSYEFYSNTADFRVSWIQKTNGNKNHALSATTSKFEQMAHAAGKGEVRITFSYVENNALRTSSEWAKSYGYNFEFVPSETGPGTVIWTKKL